MMPGIADKRCCDNDWGPRLHESWFGPSKKNSCRAAEDPDWQLQPPDDMLS